MKTICICEKLLFMAHIGTSFIFLQLFDFLFNAVQSFESMSVLILNRHTTHSDQFHLDTVQAGRFPFIQQITAIAPVIIPEDSDWIFGTKE